MKFIHIVLQEPHHIIISQLSTQYYKDLTKLQYASHTPILPGHHHITICQLSTQYYMDLTPLPYASY